MPEAHAGYIYRHASADAATLRELLASCTVGWAWDVRTLVQGLAQVDANLEQCMEGRAFGATRDIRWRRDNRQFDLLLLTLSDQPPAGFVPLLPAPDTPWHTAEMPYRWQVAPIPNGPQDKTYVAIQFRAPDGSIQFVALTDRIEGDAHAG